MSPGRDATAAPAVDRKSAPPSWDDPEPEDDPGADVRKMRNLVRALAIIMGVPAWSIALAYLMFEDPAQHVPHIVLYGLVAVATVVAFLMAPAWAAKWAAR